MLAIMRGQAYFHAMNQRISLALLVALAAPALAFGATQPKPLGVFQKWTAATYGTGASEACYAFTTAPAAKGSKAAPAMLTVTERAGDPDEISVSQGVNYAKDAKPTVKVGGQTLPFFTKGDTAYALHGNATTKAFLGGSNAIATSPTPDGKTVTDTFSLTGFSDAYKAIQKACPQAKATKASSSKKSSKKK